jgi:TrmH family RNA methyltransferase
MSLASQRIFSRIVQSRQNRRVKELRASFSPGNRNETGQVGIEGEHLLIEAIRSGIEIVAVFVRSGSEDLLSRIGDRIDERIGLNEALVPFVAPDLAPEIDILELPDDVFASAVTTESPQGVAALVKPRAFSLAQILAVTKPLAVPKPLIVVAAALQDPGNLGTLIRSAEAFGATGLVTLPGTVSPWNAKALRASSGSAFRLPVVAASEAELFPLLRKFGIQILAAVADHAQSSLATDFTQPTAILIGNEGRGLSPELIAAASARVTIPCPGPVESLNAAIAASILLYEASRQRGSTANPGQRIQATELKETL